MTDRKSKPPQRPAQALYQEAIALLAEMLRKQQRRHQAARAREEEQQRHKRDTE